MVDRAGQHVSDGLDAPVRMPWEPGAVVVGPVVAEIVQQQERVEVAGIAESESAMELHPGALHRGVGLDDALDWSNGHDAPCLSVIAGPSCGDGGADRPGQRHHALPGRTGAALSKWTGAELPL